MAKLHEECGVFGVYSTKEREVASTCYYAMFAMQHRGQESCGIAVVRDGQICFHKDAGLAGEVFTPNIMSTLPRGRIAVAHVRYGTGGQAVAQYAQPIVVTHHISGPLALTFNGCLTNSVELVEELEAGGAILPTKTDAEIIAHLLVRESLTGDSLEEAVSRAMTKLLGAYSLVIMTPRALIAARDPLGFHPLCMGAVEDETMFASETCVLDSVGAQLVRDLLPGEIVTVDSAGVHTRREHCGKSDGHLCVFEYIYFARPDSVIDGCSVQLARQRAGAFLAEAHPVEADIVIGVPDSGLDAAIGYAYRSGIPYGIGFIKNKYIGRTFIQPGQSHREDLVRIKLNAVPSAVAGKRVVLVDDSIVRGTTGGRIVRLLRQAGAKEVHMRSSAPPFLYPCFYGTDIDAQSKLVACRLTLREIAALLDVDSLGYLPCEYAEKLAPECQTGFCSACFTGKYPTEIPSWVERPKMMAEPGVPARR